MFISIGMHEKRCQHRIVGSRQTCYRAVDRAADRVELATVTTIVRSSPHPPKSWFAHAETIQQGLPIIGASIAKEFADLAGIELSSCVLRRTRELPARKLRKESSEEISPTSTPLRMLLHKSHYSGVGDDE